MAYHETIEALNVYFAVFSKISNGHSTVAGRFRRPQPGTIRWAKVRQNHLDRAGDSMVACLFPAAIELGQISRLHRGGILWPLNATITSLTAGALLIAIGQLLNIGVFYRLGKVGMFYGNKFGYRGSLAGRLSVLFFQAPAVHRDSAVDLGLFPDDAFSP